CGPPWWRRWRRRRWTTWSPRFRWVAWDVRTKSRRWSPGWSRTNAPSRRAPAATSREAARRTEAGSPWRPTPRSGRRSPYGSPPRAAPRAARETRHGRRAGDPGAIHRPRSNRRPRRGTHWTDRTASETRAVRPGSRPPREALPGRPPEAPRRAGRRRPGAPTNPRREDGDTGGSGARAPAPRTAARPRGRQTRGAG